MSSDLVLVRGVRSVVGLSVWLATSVDESAYVLDEVQERGWDWVRQLPVPRLPEEL